jgi:hypothetical protein
MSKNIAYTVLDHDFCSRHRVHAISIGNVPDSPYSMSGYIAPEVAILANPIYDDIRNPRLLKIHSSEPWETDGFQRWTQGLRTTLGEAPVPVLSMLERVAWAICLTPHESTREWAVHWLSDKGRYWSAEKDAMSHDAAWSAAWAALAYEGSGSPSWASMTARAAAGSQKIARKLAAVSVNRAANNCADKVGFENRLMPTLAHARKILAGEIPADQYANLQV